MAPDARTPPCLPPTPLSLADRSPLWITAAAELTPRSANPLLAAVVLHPIHRSPRQRLVRMGSTTNELPLTRMSPPPVARSETRQALLPALPRTFQTGTRFPFALGQGAELAPRLYMRRSHGGGWLVGSVFFAGNAFAAGGA